VEIAKEFDNEEVRKVCLIWRVMENLDDSEMDRRELNLTDDISWIINSIISNQFITILTSLILVDSIGCMRIRHYLFIRLLLVTSLERSFPMYNFIN